jgi:hypothetical protein
VTDVRIGDIVNYHSGGADAPGIGDDLFVIAAMVTMTPQQWQPGYRTPDGEWVETKDVKQPKAGCVHLKLFLPPGLAAGTQVDFTDIPEGTTHGTWGAR